MDPLTPREAEIARMIARGWSRKRIADKLGISIRTVDAHIANAAGRLPGKGHPKLRLVLFVIEERKREGSAA